MTEPPAIATAGLGKAFGDRAAIRRVDLTVAPGERILLTGPNGAGKTTLLRLLALLLQPSVGQIRLAGRDPRHWGAAARAQIGYLGHQTALYPDLTAAENLAFYARLYRVAKPDRRIDELLDRFDLADRRHLRVRVLSRGQQQRLALARAVLHDPPILLLDEPDTGLDAPGLATLSALIAEPGRAVLVSTHHPDWATAICDRRIHLERGRIVGGDGGGGGPPPAPPDSGGGPPSPPPSPPQPAYLSQLWAILWKDFVLEARRRELLGTMGIFTLLVLVIFTFALDLAAEYAPIVAPGALWVAYVFAGTLGFGRGFAAEAEWGTLEGLLLAPVDRSAIYLAKAAGNAIFLGAIELASLPIVVAFFNLPVIRLELLPVLTLGTIGFAAVATLFTALATNARAREVLLPVLLFPVIVPVVIASVKATMGVIDGAGFGPWASILITFDAIFLVVAFLTFEHVVEE